MIDIKALQGMVAFHARRGDPANVEPAKLLEVLSALQLCLDGLHALASLQHNPEASAFATEIIRQVDAS